MFIVTYTAEHNHPAPTHRNSLAGSTRQKPLTPPLLPSSSAASVDAVLDFDKAATGSKPSPCSPPGSTLSNSNTTSPSSSLTEKNRAVEDDDGNDFLGEGDGAGEEDYFRRHHHYQELAMSEMVMGDDFFVGLEELAGPITGDGFSDPFPASFTLPWVANSNAATAGGGR